MTLTQLGTNTITAIATDNAGNKKTVISSITVDDGIVVDTSDDRIIFLYRSNMPAGNNLAESYSVLARSTDMVAQFSEELLPPETNIIPGERSVTYFSLKAIQANINLLKQNGYDWVVYDIEPEFSPPSDVNDPVNHVIQAANIVHANGLKLLVTPAQLSPQAFLDIAKNSDGIVLQAQQVVREDPSRIVSMASQFVSKVKEENPDVLVYLQMSASFNTLGQMKIAYDTSREFFDGTTVFYNRADDYPRLLDILEYINTVRTQ